MNIHHLQSRLHYDPETGVFTWIHKEPHRVAGHVREDGYCVIRYCNQLFLAHRLAYFWMLGKWPPEEIDHRNRQRDDNRWENLREATTGENSTNRKAKGYHQRTRKGRSGLWYAVHIEKDGKKYSTTLRSEEAAKQWRANKEQELFGEFAREVVQ